MQGFQFIAICIIVGGIGLSGCATKSPQPLAAIAPQTSLPQLVQQRIDSDSQLPWVSEERAFILVDKGCGTVSLYLYGHLTKTYPAVFGRAPGRKTHEGDKRTPLGLYMIVDKDHHRRWSRFMRIDYPNAGDRLQYQKNLKTGKIPKRQNGYAGPGGAIGIHGTDNEAFNRAKINWTLGCISMLNKDVNELYRLVPIGTLVYIKN